jgi:hypothetical protein
VVCAIDRLGRGVSVASGLRDRISGNSAGGTALLTEAELEKLFLALA